ncbi:hypothetical protein Pla52o_20840 [Novipirellula galeiformis]|uniref:Uncharacterized protein n=1 Tax=Novipirellula galeiformis TaxID=2528004 RepID=A0A5C6CHM9_9BACT|nr:hypothetical protein Pla52o_20840 [Novipirellula galeiformis]
MHVETQGWQTNNVRWPSHLLGYRLGRWRDGEIASFRVVMPLLKAKVGLAIGFAEGTRWINSLDQLQSTNRVLRKAQSQISNYEKSGSIYRWRL